MTKNSKNWQKRRLRSDIARPQVKRSTQLKEKCINIFRRLTIFVLSIFYKKYRDAPLPQLSEIRSIFIIPNDPIGDLLLSSPLWNKLLKEKPSLRIGIGVSERNREIALYIPKVSYYYDVHTTNVLRLFRSIRRAKKDGYDVVLTTAGYYRPTRFAFISRLIAGKGFTATMHTSRSERYARIYSWCRKRRVNPYPQPMVEQYQDMIEQIFQISFTAEERIPALDLTSKVLYDTQRIENVLSESMARSYIHLNLEAKISERELGIDKSKMLIRKIREQYPHIIALVTASKEYWHEYGSQFNSEDGIIRFDTPTLATLIDVVHNATLVISPDTAVVHIAASLHKPIIAFYPLKDEWLPYGVNACIFFPEHEQPVSTIPLESVLKTALEVLKVYE
jgi:ADP-heptose:LPS heptosyltransferase